MRRSIAKGIGVALVGAGSAVVVTQQAAHGVETWFRERSETVEPPVEGLPLRLPVLVHRSDGMVSYHGASLAAVQDRLPTDSLVPVRLSDDRAVVLVGLFHHREHTIQDLDGEVRTGVPYGEAMVAALVTRRPRRRLLPLVTSVLGFAGTEAFVLHQPVTTRAAREVGRRGWGLPRFVADMDLADEVGTRRLLLSDRDAEILSLTVQAGQRLFVDRHVTVLYSVSQGRLLRTALPSIASGSIHLGRSAGLLTIGRNHPMAEDLLQLQVGSRSLLSQTIENRRFVLPSGVDAGPAEPWPGIVGDDRDAGRFTIRYPGTGPLDLYAGRRDAIAREVAVAVGTSGMPEREPTMS